VKIDKLMDGRRFYIHKTKDTAYAMSFATPSGLETLEQTAKCKQNAAGKGEPVANHLLVPAKKRKAGNKRAE
jgi:hypothetical protein